MKGQIVTLDVVIAVLIFVLSTALMLSLFFAIPGPRDPSDTELLHTFENLQASLEGTTVAFYKDYRVDAAKLLVFADTAQVDTYFLGETGSAQGLGLTPEAYDICFYFIDSDGSPIIVNGRQSIGSLRDSTCHDRMVAGRQLCDGYASAMAVFRPVLFDEGTPNTNRIVQMNVVACKV